MLSRTGEEIVPAGARVAVVTDGQGLEVEAAEVGRLCRVVAPTIVDSSKRSLTAKLKAADRAGVALAAIIVPGLADRRALQLKDMSTREQREVAWADLVESLS